MDLDYHHTHRKEHVKANKQTKFGSKNSLRKAAWHREKTP
jgi:hypothetical protein